MARGALAAVAIAALAACATRGPSPAVEQARADINRIAAQADVARLAPTELRSAQDSLVRAESAHKDGADGAEVQHLSYLARQRAEIAAAVARTRLADERVRAGNDEATRMRLQARTLEAERARMQAAQSQSQAQAAQAQAAQSQAQAQAADQQARDAQARAAAAQQQAAQQVDQARAQAAAAQQQASQQVDQARAQAAAAQAALVAMQARVKEIEALSTERGYLVTLGDVLFETGRHELLPSAAARMDKLAAFLREYPERKLLVEGHTDSVGGDALNDALSQRRAESVRMALVQRGVDPSRIGTTGYGKRYPVADNASAEGRAQNRRVEVVITDDKGVLRGRG